MMILSSPNPQLLGALGAEQQALDLAEAPIAARHSLAAAAEASASAS